MIIESFNNVHIGAVVIIATAVFLLLYFVLKNRSHADARKVLLIICAVNAVGYLIYKFIHAANPDYDFILLNNLPLHFCNINLFLLPLAIWSKNKNLLAYQLYFGSSMAAFALLTPDPSWMSKSVFDIALIFYFYYHSMLLFIPIMLVKYKLFRPSIRHLVQPILILLGLTLAMHTINWVFRSTGIAPSANYGYTYGVRGDPFTEFYWAFIPYELLYLLPSMLTFVPWVIGWTLPFAISDWRKRRAIDKAQNMPLPSD